MSLTLDNLKKLKKQQAGGSVPPGMINLAPKQKSKKPSPVLIVLLLFAIAGFGVVMFLSAGGSKYAATDPVTLNGTKPVGQPVQTAPERQNTPVTKQTPAKTPSAGIAAKAEPAISEEDIQKRIDEAVRTALANSDKTVNDMIQSNRDANIQRAGMIDKLPSQAGENKEMPQTKAKPAESIRKAESTLSAAIADEPEAKSVKPVISDKQRKEFNKKIQYNTTLAIADRAFADRNYQKAIDNYNSAMRQKATQPTLLNLIRAKLKIGDVRSVAPLISRYGYVVDAKGLSIAALSMSDAGYPASAQQLLSDYKSTMENSSVLYYTSGQIYEKNGKAIQAEQEYAEAHRELPADPYYAYAYARALDINKKYKEALEMYIYVVGQAGGEIKVNAESRAAVLSSYLRMLEKESSSSADSE